MPPASSGRHRAAGRLDPAARRWPTWPPSLVDEVVDLAGHRHGHRRPRVRDLFREDWPTSGWSPARRPVLVIAGTAAHPARRPRASCSPCRRWCSACTWPTPRRIRTRTEQQAWQRLARTTDALNVVDLDQVLHHRRHPGRRALLRRRGRDRAARRRPDRPRRRRRRSPTTGRAARPATIGRHRSCPPAGRPRPHRRRRRCCGCGSAGRSQLSEREQYTLRTFASALCTAVRNAQAYAELARIADEHAYAAAHDALTGLANRRHLLDQGTEQLSARHADGVTALVLIDLNHFKEVNDTLGHAAGDQVLRPGGRPAARRRPPDDLVARLGGDEFAVLLRGLPAPAVAAHRAETLLAALHEPLELDGMRISVEASGGIAVAPASGGMAGAAAPRRRGDVPGETRRPADRHVRADPRTPPT